MGIPKLPVSGATSSVGFTTRLVTVTAITPDNMTAITVDSSGVEAKVPMTIQRSKGVLPAVGEQWIISQDISNTWSFAAIATNNPATFQIPGSAIVPASITSLQLAPGAAAGNTPPGSIPGTAIAPSSITGDEIAAQTISALNLAMAAAATNIILDPGFTSPAINVTRKADPATAGTWAIASPNAVASGAALATFALMPSALVPLYVNPGEQYYLSASITLSGGTATGGIQFVFNTGAALGPDLSLVSGANTVAQLITIPPGVSSAYVRLIVSGLSGGNTATFSKPVCYITAGPNQLQAGSVTNSAIALGAVTANSLAVGSVTANAIAANAVDASKIVANTIGVAQLAAGIVYAGIVDSTVIEGSFFIAGGGGGTTWESAVPTTPGYFMYYDSGVGNPTLIFSTAASAGSDQWGNTWQGGSTFVGLPGVATNILTVVDTTGAVLAGFDSSGNITGQTVNVGTDVVVGGNSVTDSLNAASGGIINRGWTTDGVFPAIAIGGTETVMLELDQLLSAGRVYEVKVIPTNFIPTAATQFVMKLRWTTDGSTPTTSTTPVRTRVTECSTANFNYMTPYIEGIFAPTVDTLYRFLLCISQQSSGVVQFQNYCEIRITDLGVQTGSNFTNNGAILGVGTTGSSSSLQTYTEYFYTSDSWSYFSNGTQRSHNSTFYQGAYQGDTNSQYSYLLFTTGTLGNALNTVLNYAGVNWVKFRLSNLGSWYSNGTTVSLHSATAVNGALSAELTNWFIAEGATYRAPLSSGAWAPFKSSGVYAALRPPVPQALNLGYYGYFYGGGGATSFSPCMIVNYTH